ncbi:hypothetical protein D3C86_975950 [compost metagenome]
MHLIICQLAPSKELLTYGARVIPRGNFMKKQITLWTLAALIFVAGYALYLAFSDIKDDCAEQQVVSTTLCATMGS